MLDTYRLAVADVARRRRYRLVPLFANVRWTRIFVVCWLVVSIPTVAILMASSRLRETVSAMIAEHRKPSIVLVGDSFTSGGGNWADRLELPPFTARNFGRGGFTSEQMLPLMQEAVRHRPQWIALCAGANDVISRHYSKQNTVSDIARLIETAHGHGVRVVLTTVPQRSQHHPEIEALNHALRSLDADALVDLNPVVAPDGALLREYTTDGVHFTPTAYQVWASSLRVAIDSANLSSMTPDPTARQPFYSVPVAVK